MITTGTEPSQTELQFFYFNSHGCTRKYFQKVFILSCFFVYSVAILFLSVGSVLFNLDIGKSLALQFYQTYYAGRHGFHTPVQLVLGQLDLGARDITEFQLDTLY